MKSLTKENIKNLKRMLRHWWRNHEESECQMFDGLWDRLTEAQDALNN